MREGLGLVLQPASCSGAGLDKGLHFVVKSLTGLVQKPHLYVFKFSKVCCQSAWKSILWGSRQRCTPSQTMRPVVERAHGGAFLDSSFSLLSWSKTILSLSFSLPGGRGRAGVEEFMCDWCPARSFIDTVHEARRQRKL